MELCTFCYRDRYICRHEPSADKKDCSGLYLVSKKTLLNTIIAQDNDLKNLAKTYAAHAVKSDTIHFEVKEQLLNEIQQLKIENYELKNDSMRVGGSR